jgi:hypothetical protein
LVLVHDEGVYLMSGGLPGLKAKNGKTSESQAVVYARGCNPRKNKDCWDHSRELVGGDDFAEILDARGIAKIIKDGAIRLFIELSAESITVSAECVA